MKTNAMLGVLLVWCMAAVMAPDEKAVFEELCEVVEEAIAIYHKDGKPLPPSTSGRDFANKMQNVA
jgi:hypothetical protein